MPKKKIDLFYQAFIGEFVHITTKIKTTRSVHSPDGSLEETAPMIAEGYLLDADDEYLYLGYTPESITRAVDRTEISMVDIAQEPNLYDEILDQMPDPASKDIN